MNIISWVPPSLYFTHTHVKRPLTNKIQVWTTYFVILLYFVNYVFLKKKIYTITLYYFACFIYISSKHKYLLKIAPIPFFIYINKLSQS